MIHSHPQSGFTLVELLVALSISAMVVMMASTIFTYGVQHTRTIAAESQLIAAASHFTDVLAYQLRPATAVSVAGTELTITNTDYSLNILDYTGTTVTLDGEAIFDDDIIPNYVTFTIIDKTVQISYELDIDLGASDAYDVTPIAATTTIALRN